MLIVILISITTSASKKAKKRTCQWLLPQCEGPVEAPCILWRSPTMSTYIFIKLIFHLNPKESSWIHGENGFFAIRMDSQWWPQSVWVQRLCPVFEVDVPHAPLPCTISCLHPVSIKNYLLHSFSPGYLHWSVIVLLCLSGSCLRPAIVLIIILLQQTLCLWNLYVHHVGKSCNECGQFKRGKKEAKKRQW